MKCTSPGVGIGECTDGGQGHPCVTTSDCDPNTDYVCRMKNSTAKIACWHPGDAGDWCAHNSDCKGSLTCPAGFCFACMANCLPGTCSSGNDCCSGKCSRCGSSACHMCTKHDGSC